MTVDPDIPMNDIEKFLIEKHGFDVTSAGDRFVVRDKQNKKLGKGGKLEGGNLHSLLVQAIDAREKATAVPVRERKRSSGTKGAKTKPATVAPPQPPVAARSRSSKKRATRDTSAMDAVYDAVIDGIAPGEVHKYVTTQLRIHLKSAPSTYTHAAIAARVVKRALLKGWSEPKEEEEDAPESEKGTPQANN